MRLRRAEYWSFRTWAGLSPPLVLDLHAEVHDHDHPGCSGPLSGAFVNHLELATDSDLDALGDGVLHHLAQELGAAENVDNVDVEGHIHQRPVDLLAENLGGGGMDGNDSIAVPLQVLSHPERRPGGVSAEPGDGDGSTIEEAVDVALDHALNSSGGGPVGPPTEIANCADCIYISSVFGFARAEHRRIIHWPWPNQLPNPTT